MNRTYQVDFSALVRVGMVEEVASARFNQIARHFDVVVSEVQQQHLETVQSVGARVQAKLGQLTDETDDFHFGLDVDLVLLTVPGGREIHFKRDSIRTNWNGVPYLFAHVVLKVLLEEIAQLGRHFGDVRMHRSC